MAGSALPLRQLLPVPVATAAASSAQQAFRQAIREVEELREQLGALRTSQAATRQAYWHQVGPLAAAAVAAHRALFEPLETALTAGYLARAEVEQVTEFLWQQAHGLQTRFGEDETERLNRYAPGNPPSAAPQPASATPAASPDLPPHEQAAAEARTRRQQRTQQARAAQAHAADAAGQALLHNTKVAYRQLARLHHPDRAAQADAPTQQAQTELMQRITAAYAAHDLAALLALLAEGASPTHPTAEAEALLHRYTQALTQQQTQLRQQLTIAQHAPDDALWSGTEKQQRTRLRQLKRDLRDETAYLHYLRRQFQDPAALRQWLKANRRNQ